ncbi:MAG: nucleoside deaminase, partial [Candidatus Hermodarchaeota archaeon]
NDKILVRTHDTEVTDNDPTAHAEMNGIKEAIKIIGKELKNCTLISTHEPCPMCMTAIIWSKIPVLVYSVSIEDSLKQGRNMINISCDEIKSRSNSKILISGGILKEKCLKLYNFEIREKIKLLRNSLPEDWKKYEKKIFAKRKRWFYNNKSEIKKLNGSEIEKAFKLLITKLDINENEIPIIYKSDNKLVFHSKNFCPTLEACKILNLDTKTICKAIYEKPTDEFIKMINPNLQFIRNYDAIRPYCEYCEEAILFHN